MKLPPLNDAKPFVVYDASRMVIVEPVVSMLAGSTAVRLTAPVTPFILFTTSVPGQSTNESTPPTPDTRHFPESDVPRLVTAPVPLPITKAFAGNDERPVPPLATPSGVVKVRPAKVGVALVLILWTVETAPFVTVRLSVLNEASPFVEEVASWMRMVFPVTCKLEAVTVSIVTSPVRLFTLLTPPEPGQVAKLKDPPVPDTKH
tara:strand:- start:710 stop:1321 length:612 start_codon:yes stop_codon:yes gene_type:complete